MLSPAADQPTGSALQLDASPQQLRDVLAAEPWRTLEVAVHPNADAALRQWLWQSDDVELRLGMYEHYRLQRHQLLNATQPLPAEAIQFDAAVAQMSGLLEYTGTNSLDHPAFPEETVVVKNSSTRKETYSTTALRFANGTTVPLTSARVLIGRQPEQTNNPHTQLVTVPDPDHQISSTHALIEAKNGQWYITDLHSNNGTTLGERRHAQTASPGTTYVAPRRFWIGAHPIEFVTL